MKLLRLALRNLRREWRLPELRTLAGSLLLAVLALGVVATLAARVERGILASAAELIGGDIGVSAPQAVPLTFADEAHCDGLAISRTAGFPSVAFAHERSQLLDDRVQGARIGPAAVRGQVHLQPARQRHHERRRVRRVLADVGKGDRVIAAAEQRGRERHAETVGDVLGRDPARIGGEAGKFRQAHRDGEIAAVAEAVAEYHHVVEQSGVRGGSRLRGRSRARGDGYTGEEDGDGQGALFHGDFPCGSRVGAPVGNRSERAMAGSSPAAGSRAMDVEPAHQAQAESSGQSGHAGGGCAGMRERGRDMDTAAADVTRLLKAWNGGDEAALAELTERVYAELHRIAHRYMRNERKAGALQTTALVNEAYLRLADAAAIDWRGRAQFFAVAAQMMRRVLVDAAREREAHKRGGGAQQVDLDEAALVSGTPDRTVLALDDALTSFSQLAPRQAQVVELRYFGGLTEDEIAATLGIAARTVRRDWDLAKAWLLRELSQP